MYTTLISATDLQSLLARGAPLAVFDCSFDLADPGAADRLFAQAHIAGARQAHLDRDLSAHAGAPRESGGRHPLPTREAFAAWLGARGVSAATQVVVYERSGANYCGRLWWMLKWLGHEAAAVLDGGLAAWQAAGGALDVQAAARLVAKVARAVDHLHRQGYVHRDLKPSNILLDADGEPYVTDFGLAKVFLPGTEPTATGAIVGTPSYMAPEQAAGQGAEVGPASDVYSLGAILYELLTGQPPFRQETPLDTLLAVLGGEPKPPRQIDRRVPRALELIAMKCLARAPSQRYASAAALADDLERFLRHEELEARPPHLVQRVYRWFRREPALAARLATLLAFYTVEAVVYTLGTVEPAFHQTVSLLVVVWVVTALGLQQFLKNGQWPFAARYLWGTLDSALLLAVLLVADGAASSLVVGYPLLIVASSLWYRVRFVWFTSALSLVSYGVLVWDFYVRRPELQARCYPGFERHVVFVLALLAFAGVTAHLVDRLRSLSTYYGHKGQEGRL
jgi:serine/threonine-protein kinase